MQFKVKYYANKAGIVKPASKWHEQPHKYPERYFALGELAANLSPYFINWPSRLPIVYRSIRGADLEQVGSTFGYQEWLEKVTCKEIGLVEELFFQTDLWCKSIDEFCDIFLTKTSDGEYWVCERIQGLGNDSILSKSDHFLAAILFVSACIRSAK